MATSSAKQGYRKSTLLTKEENEKIRGMLGEGCQALATSVIQLFMTEPPEHKEWIKKDAGILCLERDHPRRSYFLRLYCLKRQTQVWEMELYKNMEYDSPKPFLHVFEGQDRVFALNFASDAEAEQTFNIINAKLEKSKQKNANKEPVDAAGPSTSTEGEEGAAAPETLEDAEAGKTQEEAAEGDTTEGGGSPAVSASEKTESPEATGAESEPGGDAGAEEAPKDDAAPGDVKVILPPASDEEQPAETITESQQRYLNEASPQMETENPSSVASMAKDAEVTEESPQEEVAKKDSEVPVTKQHSTFTTDPDDRPPFPNEDITTLLAKAREDKMAREEKEKEAREEMEGIAEADETSPAEGGATNGEESKAA